MSSKNTVIDCPTRVALTPTQNATHTHHSATFATASPAVSALGLDKIGITRPVRF